MTPHGFRSDMYHCLLDEQPYYLVPEHSFQAPEILGTPRVNPDCWFSWHGQLSPDMAAPSSFPETFDAAEPIVWARDPATLCLWPFWVGDEYFAYLRDMTPGCDYTLHLPPHVRWVLTEANILIDPDQQDRRRRDWQEQVLQYAGAFEYGYVQVSGLIHPFHLGALRRYYRYRTRNGFFIMGDEQVRRRFAAHNEAVARFVHRQLTRAISDVAGTVLKPSYAYFVSYLAGAELQEHVDRPQCDYSMTACIDASPEPRPTSPWPIKVGSGEKSVSVYQRLGDALIYRGCQVPHRRDRLPSGYTSASLLLHYVHESFGGSLA